MNAILLIFAMALLYLYVFYIPSLNSVCICINSNSLFNSNSDSIFVLTIAMYYCSISHGNDLISILTEFLSIEELRGFNSVSHDSLPRQARRKRGYKESRRTNHMAVEQRDRLYWIGVDTETVVYKFKSLRSKGTKEREWDFKASAIIQMLFLSCRVRCSVWNRIYIILKQKTYRLKKRDLLTQRHKRRQIKLLNLGSMHFYNCQSHIL